MGAHTRAFALVLYNVLIQLTMGMFVVLGSTFAALQAGVAHDSIESGVQTKGVDVPVSPVDNPPHVLAASVPILVKS